MILKKKKNICKTRFCVLWLYVQAFFFQDEKMDTDDKDVKKEGDEKKKEGDKKKDGDKKEEVKKETEKEKKLDPNQEKVMKVRILLF